MPESANTKPPLSPDYWGEAKHYLSAKDPIMAGIIANYPEGALTCRGHAFETLCRSIVGQQISVKAADSMWGKFEAVLKDTSFRRMTGSGARRSRPRDKHGVTDRELWMHPDTILIFSDEPLRACGLSRQKIAYLRNIAEFFNDEPRRLNHGHWHAMEDEVIIEQLVSIKGVGGWTAEMFLIFHVMHPDVFPIGDIGIQKGIELHYNCPPLRSADLRDGTRLKAGSDICPRRASWDALHKKQKPYYYELVAEQWAPYRTVATWYLWRSLDPVPVAY